MSQQNRPAAVVSWSSGKDCAFALYKIRSEGVLDVVGLLTTLNQENQRVAMHGVRKELLQMQMDAVGLPNEMVMLPMPCDNETYRARVGAAMDTLLERGVEQIVFGDLYLEDVRQYRVEQMQGSGIEPCFPLWQEDTKQLSREMVDCGLRAVVTCVDLRVLPIEFLGRSYDQAFLDSLPANVDPCGENGEFHTVVTAGPMFSGEIAVELGETVISGDFAHIDVIPAKG